MNIVFDTKYGSRVNGTAGPTSDDDTYFVYTLPTHDGRSLIANSGGTVKEGKDRTGFPLWRFLRDCYIGEALSIDLLFLPDTAYAVAPPKPLMVNRDIFVNRNSLNRYIAWADRFKSYIKDGGDGWKPRAAYYSLLYLNSARSILTSGRPAYYDPSFVATAKRAHDGLMGPQEYAALFQSMRDEIRGMPNTLRPQPPMREVESLHRLLLNLGGVGYAVAARGEYGEGVAKSNGGCGCGRATASNGTRGTTRGSRS